MDGSNETCVSGADKSRNLPKDGNIWEDSSGCLGCGIPEKLSGIFFKLVEEGDQTGSNIKHE